MRHVITMRGSFALLQVIYANAALRCFGANLSTDETFEKSLPLLITNELCKRHGNVIGRRWSSCLVPPLRPKSRLWTAIRFRLRTIQKFGLLTHSVLLHRIPLTPKIDQAEEELE